MHDINSLKIYIVSDIIMAIIEFMKNQTDGSKPVLVLLNHLKERAQSSSDDAQLLSLIIRGMEFLEKHGLPVSLGKYFVSTRDDGGLFTILLAKELKYHRPLLEFRMNWLGTGAFRVVFFEFESKGNQILVFSRATIKQETSSKEFEDCIKETEALLPDFLDYPEKYISL